MSTVHFRNARIFVDGFELTGDMDELSVLLSADMLDQTNFGDVVRTYKGGLTIADITGAGNYDATYGHVDSILFGIQGVDDKLITVFANGITEGPAPATGSGFSLKGVLDKYDLSGKVSTLLRFVFDIKGRGTGGD